MPKDKSGSVLIKKTKKQKRLPKAKSDSVVTKKVKQINTASQLAKKRRRLKKEIVQNIVQTKTGTSKDRQNTTKNYEIL